MSTFFAMLRKIPCPPALPLDLQTEITAPSSLNAVGKLGLVVSMVSPPPALLWELPQRREKSLHTQDTARHQLPCLLEKSPPTTLNSLHPVTAVTKAQPSVVFLADTMSSTVNSVASTNVTALPLAAPLLLCAWTPATVKLVAFAT